MNGTKELSFSVSLIQYITLQLEYTLLERQIDTIFHKDLDEKKIVELEMIYHSAYQLEQKALAQCFESATNLAQRAKVIKRMIRDFYCTGKECYFNY